MASIWNMLKPSSKAIHSAAITYGLASCMSVYESLNIAYTQVKNQVSDLLAPALTLKSLAVTALRWGAGQTSTTKKWFDFIDNGASVFYKGLQAVNMYKICVTEQRLPSTKELVFFAIQLGMSSAKISAFLVQNSFHLAVGCSAATVATYTASCIIDSSLNKINKSLAQLQAKDRPSVDAVKDLEEIKNLTSTKAKLESLKYYVDSTHELSLSMAKYFVSLCFMNKVANAVTGVIKGCFSWLKNEPQEDQEASREHREKGSQEQKGQEEQQRQEAQREPEVQEEQRVQQELGASEPSEPVPLKQGPAGPPSAPPKSEVLEPEPTSVQQKPKAPELLQQGPAGLPPAPPKSEALAPADGPPPAQQEVVKKKAKVQKKEQQKSEEQLKKVQEEQRKLEASKKPGELPLSPSEKLEVSPAVASEKSNLNGTKLVEATTSTSAPGQRMVGMVEMPRSELQIQKMSPSVSAPVRSIPGGGKSEDGTESIGVTTSALHKPEVTASVSATTSAGVTTSTSTQVKSMPDRQLSGPQELEVPTPTPAPVKPTPAVVETPPAPISTSVPAKSGGLTSVPQTQYVSPSVPAQNNLNGTKSLTVVSTSDPAKSLPVVGASTPSTSTPKIHLTERSQELLGWIQHYSKEKKPLWQSVEKCINVLSTYSLHKSAGEHKKQILKLKQDVEMLKGELILAKKQSLSSSERQSLEKSWNNAKTGTSTSASVEPSNGAKTSTSVESSDGAKKGMFSILNDIFDNPKAMIGYALGVKDGSFFSCDNSEELLKLGGREGPLHIPSSL